MIILIILIFVFGQGIIIISSLIRDRDIESIDLTLPKSWTDINVSQLRIIAGVLSTDNLINPTEIKTKIWLRMTGLKAITTNKQGVCIFQAHKGLFRAQRVQIKYTDLYTSIQQLNFVLDPVNYCVHPSGQHVTDWLNKPLTIYLNIENAYQAYLATKDESWLSNLSSLLESPSISREDITACFLFWQGFKAYIAAEYPQFFCRAENEEYQDMRAQIETITRALTSGDITKYEQVMRTPLHVALSELNAKAEEADLIAKEQAKMNV